MLPGLGFHTAFPLAPQSVLRFPPVLLPFWGTCNHQILLVILTHSEHPVAPSDLGPWSHPTSQHDFTCLLFGAFLGFSLYSCHLLMLRSPPSYVCGKDLMFSRRHFRTTDKSLLSSVRLVKVSVYTKILRLKSQIHNLDQSVNKEVLYPSCLEEVKE